MSIAIDVDNVSAVLLSDGWHLVTDESFDLDAYEFAQNGETVHGGGDGGVCPTGFTFRDSNGDRISGPITTILAVKH